MDDQTKTLAADTYDVFISYARKQRAIVEPLKELLEESGRRVFFDIQGIDAGDEFPDVIDRALKSSSIVVGAWTPDALTRPWVRRECRVAAKRGTLIPVELSQLIPLRDIPTEFFGLHYISLCDAPVEKESPGWMALDAEISRRLGRSTSDRESLEGLPQGQLLKRPKLYISDVGISRELLADLAKRLTAVGFDVGETKWSGYYIDVAPEYYDQFDVAVVAFGRAVNDVWSHAVEERVLLPKDLSVYFEPVDMTQSGYGAPVTARVLALEDWYRRPDACAKELFQELGGLLLEDGWTTLDASLPDIEVISLRGPTSKITSWKRPFSRAGLELVEPPDQRTPGSARLSVFAWGTQATPEDIAIVEGRARKGSAIVALIDHNVDVPAELQEHCNVVDLRREELNKSEVGSDEWERMIRILKRAIWASSDMATRLGIQ